MHLETLIGAGEGIVVGLAEAVVQEKRPVDGYLELAESHSKDTIAVQLMDASALVDEFHVLSAAQNAVNAWRGNYMISRSLDVEIAVYASGQKQISRALEQVGISETTSSIVTVVLGEEEEVVRAALLGLVESIGPIPQIAFSATPEKLHRIMDIFGISASEVQVFTDSQDTEQMKAAISKCVVSRVSAVALDA